MSGSLIPIARPSAPIVCPGHYESVSDAVTASKVVTAGNFAASLPVTLPENAGATGTPIFIAVPAAAGALITVLNFVGDPWDTVLAGTLAKYDWDGSQWNASQVITTSLYGCPSIEFNQSGSEFTPSQKVTIYNEPFSAPVCRLPAPSYTNQAFLIGVAQSVAPIEIRDQSDNLITTVGVGAAACVTWNGSAWAP